MITLTKILTYDQITALLRSPFYLTVT